MPGALVLSFPAPSAACFLQEMRPPTDEYQHPLLSNCVFLNICSQYWMTERFCGGEKILVGAVIKPVSYFPHIKCLMKLVVVWSLDSATVMLVVRVGAGFWSPGVSAHFLSGINFGFPSAASGRLFMACSVYLLILCPWQSVPCPRPVGARGGAC